MRNRWWDWQSGVRRLGGDGAGSTAALVVLALGFAAAAAAGALAAAAFFAPLPYRDGGRLVKIGGTFTGQGQTSPWPMSQMDFADWRRRGTAFADMSVYGTLTFNLEAAERSRHLAGELVNPGYLAILGRRPILGRFFTAEEDAKPFAHFVVVLGYDLWKGTFGGDPRVVGSVLRLNGGRYQVVGIAPPGFRGLSDQADLWVPSMLPPIPDYLVVRRERWIQGAVARLRPGVTAAAAERELAGITAALARETPNMNQGIGATVTPLRRAFFAEVRPALAWLLAAAGVALLLAVWDAGWLLGRAAAGRRAAARGLAPGEGLGAAALLLTGGGAAAGLAVAAFAGPRLVAMSGAGLPGYVDGAPDGWVVAAAVVAAWVGGVIGARLAGWGTAAAGADVGLAGGDAGLAGFGSGLAGSGSGGGAAAGGAGRRGRRRVRAALAVAQVAIAVVAVVLTVRSVGVYRQKMATELGWNPVDLLTFRIDLKGPQYMSNWRVIELLRRRYLPGIAAIAGVRQVALSNPTMPADELVVGGYMTIDDHASQSPDGTYVAMWHSVSPQLFATLGIPILAGRTFTPEDAVGNTVIVSKSWADQQWPHQNPLGRRMKQDARAVASEPWLTVVGVAADARHEGIQDDRPPAPDIYFSILQFPLRLPLTINFLVRPEAGTSLDELRPRLHQAMATIDPEIPDYDVATAEERLARETRTPRFQAVLRGLLAALALALAGAAAWGAAGDRAEWAAESREMRKPRRHQA